MGCKSLPHKVSTAIILKFSYFRISQNVRTVKLQKIGLDPEPGLAAAGSADDQDVLISGIGRILRPVAHHQPFGPGEDYVVLELRIHEWLDIRMGSPAG